MREGTNVNKKIYSLVWNRAHNQIVVASELATCNAAGSSAATACASKAGNPALKLAALAAALGMAMLIVPKAMASGACESCRVQI